MTICVFGYDGNPVLSYLCYLVIPCAPTGATVNVQNLSRLSRQYYLSGLSPSTRKAYQVGFQAYKTFCIYTNRQKIPTSEATLLLFVTYLADQSCSSSTIKVYLAAVRNAHVAQGEHVHFMKASTPRLQQVMKGIQREQATTTCHRIRKPITISIMSQIQRILSRAPSHHNLMIWAACCTAYFAFLRCSEFTTPSQKAFDPNCHLTLKDVAVDCRASPKIVSITIKASKTDQLRQGHTIYLGRTGHSVCPVQAMTAYLVVRGGQPGALFMEKDGTALTRQLFSRALKDIFDKLKLNYGDFNTHSFRIGAATTANQAGISDTHIKTLGRWRSNVYQSYIHTNPYHLAKLSAQLLQTPHQDDL